MFKHSFSIDKIPGADFICQAKDLYTAKEILEGFDLLHINPICELIDYEAENSGLDVY